MLTERDNKVLDFVEEFKAVKTSTIQELFYPSLQVAQRRLRDIIKNSDLKRERYTIDSEYVYYFKKSTQQRHDLILTDFYRELHKRSDIIRFDKEFTKIQRIRPDAFVVYKHQGKNYIAFIEIEISNKGLDTEKYKRMYLEKSYKNILPNFPQIIAVTNRNFQKQEFKIHKLSTNLDNINLIFK